MIKRENPKKWICCYLIIQSIFLLTLLICVLIADPFFHYHGPICKFCYILDNERSQNDGITRHFKYDTLVTGTSMTENFKTSEVDKIFGVESIKVPYSGGTFKEINDNVKKSIECNKSLELVIRGIDASHFAENRNYMRTDMGEYPTYLYDNNLFNDVEYWMNKDVIKRSVNIYCNYFQGIKGGITSFDDYSNWNSRYKFGSESVLKEHSLFLKPTKNVVLTEQERKTIKDNIQQNVVKTAVDNQNIEFYYFIPPYGIVYWGDLYQSGKVNYQIDKEQEVIETMLGYDNIHLFSYNDCPEITTNLQNYKDSMHYGEWINSIMLKYMYEGRGQITQDNYKAYLQRERELYTEYDYNSLFNTF